MAKQTDIRVRGASLYYLPIQTRVPLKFGSETLTSVTCARVRVRVEDRKGQSAVGWGETPLSVQWVWPSATPYEARHGALKEFCEVLVREWAGLDEFGHPIELGHSFLTDRLPAALVEFNRARGGEPMPWLAALVCCSAFDLAVHDAYGGLHHRPVYETYNAEFMNRDLNAWLASEGASVRFERKFPSDYLVANPVQRLAAWHLVGGKDWLTEEDVDGPVPADGYPVYLPQWIERDGLFCLKVKLRGNDAAWDYERMVRVGRIGADHGVRWLSADFNCTVLEPGYVNECLDRLRDDEPRIYGMLLYVEQPFPYDLEAHQIDVHSVSARKPLFMDESAHDWHLVLLGRRLGWNGVALKTCKTQTGALLSLCWAKAHGMSLMVQDLTNPMLAQIPHLQLAAHAGTIMGVETNSMQFYPRASDAEAAVHPGLYERREGTVDLSSIRGAGFGYRVGEIQRELAAAAVEKEL